jgi:2-C-methyl-D-erythritol 4-phosphate cytidylyltransferase / 2-C-methyl-D-erythritol 2,4-cyclodiphosphate synthase
LGNRVIDGTIAQPIIRFAQLPDFSAFMHVTAIIAAGGQGRRFGDAQPKQLLPVGGRPILERTVAAFLAHPAIDALIVALPQGLVDDPPAYLRQTSKPLRIVAGGDRRQVSVANAFGAAGATSDIIVIHDAARPFVSADLIARTIEAAAESGAALAAVASRDTVKLAFRGARGAGPAETDAGPANAGPYVRETLVRDEVGREKVRMVAETLPRETIFLAQTPQAFRRGVLAAALDAAALDPLDATDEATLVERAGLPVRLVEGEASNIKITTLEDLPIAEAIADALRNADRGLRGPDASPRESQTGIREAQAAVRKPQSAVFRVGTGYDLHRLVAGRPLVLGGVTVPSERGALGHSDADVVCHSATDAILGAACLGDIGRHFPDTDARWKDASSLDLLQEAATMTKAQGFEIVNVDVTVILETPRIRTHVDAMRAAVAQAVGLGVGSVGIKGKTNEGMDAIGRGEAIAAHAVALVRAI